MVSPELGWNRGRGRPQQAVRALPMQAVARGIPWLAQVVAPLWHKLEACRHPGESLRPLVRTIKAVRNRVTPRRPMLVARQPRRKLEAREERATREEQATREVERLLAQAERQPAAADREILVATTRLPGSPDCLIGPVRARAAQARRARANR